MGLQGVGNLTPREAARRAHEWYGARIDDSTTGKIKIYPADKDQDMVVISDRWMNGNDSRNAVSRLQRHGLDVLNEPETEKKTERADPVVTVQPSRNGHPTPAAMAAKPPAAGGDYDTVLGMLAEAEQRDKDRRNEIAVLTGLVDQLTLKATRLEELEHQGRGRYASLSKQVQAVSSRVDEALARMERMGQPQMSEAERAEQERAELTARAIALLESLPPAATMAAGSIAASLDEPTKGNLIGKLMASAASDGRVTVLKVGSQKLYRALPKTEA